MDRIDLNCDLGEGYGAYRMGSDARIIPLISSANIACGFHAGDPQIMSSTVALCREHGVGIGAHPGFPDLAGFGRRDLGMSPEEVRAAVLYQIGALGAFCTAQGVPLSHVKPHGALYNRAVKDGALARAICQAVRAYDRQLILLAPAGSRMDEAAAELGVPFAGEVFADRAYEDDGTLVARSKPGAMITDENEAVARVIGMVKEQCVRSVSGKKLHLSPRSVCVHGDSEKALLFVEKIRAAFRREGIELCPLGRMTG